MKKKNIIILLVIISLLCIPIIKLKADSGWDSDYDSGWSDTGSSWDSDWDYDGGYYGGSSSMDTTTALIIFVIIVIVVIILSSKNKTNNTNQNINNSKLSQIKKLTDEEVHNIDQTINIEEMKKYTFDLYKNVQNAWMNFDYEKLREYLSDELYNNYKMQLETLKMKNGKNIMENITYQNAYITDIKKTETLETITMILTISMKDYVVDNNNKVTRGNKFATTTITYLITLERGLQKELKYCPNCGSKLDGNASTTCPYCNSVIVKNTKKFIMTKKENIEQNWR